MPEGLAVLKWDDELGPVVTTKVPKRLTVGLDSTTSMRVYGIATLGETEDSQKPGFVSLPFDEFTLAVYYGGLNMHLKGLPSMVFLVLNPEENPGIYKDALPEIATQIFLNTEEDKYIEMVPKLYNQIARFTQMTPEQHQACIINDPVRRVILQTLTRTGTVQTSDIEQIIFSEVGKTVDVDIVLRPLIKMGVVATGWVEGLASEVIYLTRALFLLRQIASETIRALRSDEKYGNLGSQHIDATLRYHREYITKLRRNLDETIWQDSQELAKFILDFDAYDILQLLRTGPREFSELPGILGVSKRTIKKKLKELEKADIVLWVKDDEKREHVMLKCNPEVVTLYPEHLIQRSVDLHNDEEIESPQIIHYLEVLRQYHPSQFTGSIEEDID